MNETQPTQISRKSSRGTTLLVVLAALLIVAVGGALGYFGGIAERRKAAQAQVEQALSQQYELGMTDMAEGRYDVARQRFEYILQNDPGYPGAAEQLTEAMLKLSYTPTPEPTATPDLSTPDMRGAEELFNQANEKIIANDWDGAEQLLDSLRKNYPVFNTAKVDGMYYIVFRNRGVSKITTQRNLEGGIYDLTLAERFGMLDSIAGGLRTFSRIYLTGASFWDVNWEQAMYYFGQVAPYLPNLTDGSGLSASQRYGFAAAKYAEKMMAEGRACEAEEMLYTAMQIIVTDDMNTVLEEAVEACNASKPADTATPTITPTITPGGVIIPSETPSVEAPTETPTTEPPPTDTPSGG